jgi:hypothetical protein
MAIAQKEYENERVENNDQAHEPRGLDIRGDQNDTADKCGRVPQSSLLYHLSIICLLSKKSFIVPE